ncbi:MAG: 50S ribosomal protein L10 [Acidobacteriota bacterium]|nr:50S ribosomal protein L10 [Acidobacteriota bacterium]
MALSKTKKAEKVSALATELEHSTSAIIGTFKALTAAKDFDLRKTVREAGGSYHVVKNKLAARSSKGTRVEAALQGLKGVSSVAYTSGDPVALAKALSTWVKDNAEFTFKLGIVDGKVITVQEIGALATLPGREELFSKLLFLINSPAQRLATVMNATGRDLAVVINQAVEKEKFTAASAPAAVAARESLSAAQAPDAAPAAATDTPEAAPAAAAETPAHVEESAAGEQPSGAAQPENSTSSQGGEAAGTDPVEG